MLAAAYASSRKQGFEINAKMNALMNETLNVSGILLMKIFGRQPENFAQFRSRSRQVADIGVRSSIIGRWFFMGLGLISAVGTALVFWVGGHLVLQGSFTIGTIVAFASYLGGLYGPISSLANARVDLASSMVSFERVFEVLDLPVEISDRPAAIQLARPHGRVEFAAVGFRYQAAAPQPGSRQLPMAATRQYLARASNHSSATGAMLIRIQPITPSLPTALTRCKTSLLQLSPDSWLQLWAQAVPARQR